MEEGGSLLQDSPKVALAYQSKSKSNIKYWVLGAGMTVLILYLAKPLLSNEANLPGATKKPGEFDVVSWNMAAVNNNPFEYWISSKDKAYNKMMDDVAAFIENPGSKDVEVKEILTPARFTQLEQLMTQADMPESSIAATRVEYETNYQHRKIISEFMKDGDLGKKRLASMPDRFTNTINTDKGQAYRPTVINCYEGELGSLDQWWSSWTNFMFNDYITLVKSEGRSETTLPVKMLAPIKKSKYPAITLEEEAISIPLQTMAAAIFDGILVYMMGMVAPKDWQRLRSDMCSSLNKKKNTRSVEILTQSYNEADIIFLQEVATAFINTAKVSALGNQYEVLHPKVLAQRDQNSVILLRKGLFDLDSLREVTSEALGMLDQNIQVPVADGDLFSIMINDNSGKQHLLASFHGDTNGLATIPIVSAVHQYAQSAGHPRLIFGLDANTYEKGGVELGLQDMTEFVKDFSSKGILSVWGNNPNPQNYTTYNARTFLQPQLNKALKSSEKRSKGDINPKDFILFYKDQLTSTGTIKDNTGSRKYIEEMVFPTLQFPSDHGILSSKVSPL